MATCPLTNPRIGVLAPASAPIEDRHVQQGMGALRDRGFELVTTRRTFAAEGYLAGSDEARRSEFHELADDPDLDVLVAARGGYGTLRILRDLDYAAAARRPKVLVGYSDLTALQLALFAKAGWKSISGPMVAVEWRNPDDRWESDLWHLLNGAAPFQLSAANDSTPRVLRTGAATGTLLGGNLAMVCKLVGTPYLPDCNGAILFLEDVGEPPYRIDGYLAQLELAGVLDAISGVILGGFTGWEIAEGRPTLSLDDVFERYFGACTYPVVADWNYGHFPIKTPMPIGVRASLQAGSETTLTILEPVR